MSNLGTTTVSSKHYGMIANHITSTHGRNADHLTWTGTGLAFTAIDSNLVQITTQSFGNNLAIASAVPDGASTLSR